MAKELTKREAQEIIQDWENGTFIPGRVKTAQVEQAKRILIRLSKQAEYYPKKAPLIKNNKELRHHLKAIKVSIGKRSRKFRKHEKKNWQAFNIKQQLHVSKNDSKTRTPASVPFITNDKIKGITDYIRAQYSLTQAQLVEKTRKNNIVEARQVIMYLCLLNKSGSKSAVGRSLLVDHSTVIHGIQSITDRMDVDRPFKNRIDTYNEYVKLYLPVPIFDFNNFDL